jgi:Zn-dependent protease with chaperone function
MSRRRILLQIHRISLALLLLLTGTSLLAQSNIGDEKESGFGAFAWLNVHFDETGNANATFGTSQNIEDANALRGLLEKAMHCQAGALRSPESSKFSGRYLEKLSTKQRQQMELHLEQARRRQLQGTCTRAMLRDRFVFSTEMRFDDLLPELKRLGIQQLMVTISYPESGYSEHTPGMPAAFGSPKYPVARYEFRTDHADVSTVRIVFGYRKRDVYRAFAVPTVILLLPLMIMLWMRSAAIRAAKEDATAAWFGFLRALNWCTLGIMLVWCIGHGLRQGIEHLVNYRFTENGTAAIAIRIAILVAPPWIVYLICMLSSYRVYVQVRGLTWGKRDFYLAQFLHVAAVAVPFTLVLAGIETFPLNYRLSIALFVSIYFTLILLTRLRLKVTGMHPEALTSGELRDCVFDLAKRAAIELRQVLVMPAGKSQMANAFASRSKMVLFTDYLLARLTKREVTAIAAHEITHIQKRHNNWKAAGIIGLVLSPLLLRGLVDLVAGVANSLAMLSADRSMEGLVAVLNRIDSFPELDLVFYMIALLLFYLQSRILENSADVGAIRLTGDPEGMISALLKLSRLNLMPIQWGRTSGSLLTHPSTMKRVERIAKIGQVSPERLQQIVAQCQQSTVSLNTDVNTAATEDTFSEQSMPANRVVTTAKASQAAINKLWVLLFFHVAPALSIGYLVGRFHLEGQTLLAAYTAGGVLCVAIYGAVIRWTAMWERSGLQREFQAKLLANGLATSGESAWFVAFSPDALPRFYVASANWDNGYLFLAKDLLCYIGDQTSFSLRPDQIRGIRLGPGVPAWFRVPRVYIDWWDESRNAMRTCNLVSMAPCAFWRLKQQVVSLHASLARWAGNPSFYPEAASPLRALKAPAFGEVTSRSLRSLHTVRRAILMAFWIVVLSACVCTITRVPATLYVCTVVIVLRLYEHLPHWLSREKTDVAATAVAGGIGA